ncbi:NADH:flavin oxidoreductase [Mucilaginibacter galii]|uniref:12-oxophytodienoate reductase n=1 Tax=Mucilaginibacter galii TaxID=2005073 RepID=A0A917J6Z9_9SPHI|nr:NADH:flavin oxidoreductase [Mucilaginibacter galii]GGI50243.1 12-oxophytodienoate reductase [Mucilaginibacter galii]
MNTDSLFRPFSLKSLNIKNRIVMAPMTRSFSPDGVPTETVAAYYSKRAEGEVGLILSEGTVINRPSSSNDANVPHFYGEQALGGWKNVIDGVHAAGGAMGPQIWHMGVMANHASGWVPPVPFEGPSGLNSPGFNNGRTMTESDIAETITAFGKAAADAKRLGFDTVEIHGAHGYLIDQFFWAPTNERKDIWGGKTLPERSRFAIEVVKEVRRQVGEDFAIILRLSQFKPTAYDAKLANNPQEMEAWLNPLADAGVDIFHCSQRRFWEPEFEGSDLNFAGWAKKVSGKATITVGSVGLTGEFLAAFAGESSQPSSLDELVRRMDRGDFDLVAVGRPLLSDPFWVQKIREERTDELKGFSKEALGELVLN